MVALPNSTGWGARDNKALVFNDVAAYMWKRLAGGLAFEDIIHQLVLEYGTDSPAVASDLNGFVAALLKLGVLRERKNQDSSSAPAGPAAGRERKLYTSPKIHIYDPESDEEQAYVA